MSGNIAPSDSYVTPTPDPRLATLPGSWSLASDLTANSTTIKLWPDHLCGLRLRVHAQDLASIAGRKVDAAVRREHTARSKLS